MLRNPLAWRADLGHARQQANEWRVRALELEQALRDLATQVDQQPASVKVEPRSDLIAALTAGKDAYVRAPQTRGLAAVMGRVDRLLGRRDYHTPGGAQ